jgi:hypothetical protein
MIKCFAFKTIEREHGEVNDLIFHFPKIFSSLLCTLYYFVHEQFGFD